jgi:16S rRNA A1518/A1519 N6-dimethyltransferase RsmA/KsgA/DIM1 with predicted DNA glycosylase/AP lyase activity
MQSAQSHRCYHKQDFVLFRACEGKIPDMKLAINPQDTRANKGLGQNFLVNDHFLEIISNNARGQVFEIGTGLGHLTHWLARRAEKVLTFEIDPVIFKAASKNLCGFANVEMVCDDARNYRSHIKAAKEWLVFSNLPYSNYLDILLTFFEDNFQEYYITLQKEVYEKMTAAPNESKYSALGVVVSHWFRVKRICGIGRSAFSPRPHVDSVFCKLSRRNHQKFSTDMYKKLKSLMTKRNSKLGPLGMRPRHMTPEQLVQTIQHEDVHV